LVLRFIFVVKRGHPGPHSARGALNLLTSAGLDDVLSTNLVGSVIAE
jgi:hypothetical protein